LPVTLGDVAGLRSTLPGNGAETKPQASLTLASQFLHIDRHQQFGQAVGGGDIFFTSLQGQLPVTRWLQVRARLPHVLSRADLTGDTESGLGDPLLGLVATHAHDSHFWGGSFDVSFPLGDADQGLGAGTHLARVAGLAGSKLAGQSNLRLRGGAGLSWSGDGRVATTLDYGAGILWTPEALPRLTVFGDLWAETSLQEGASAGSGLLVSVANSRPAGSTMAVVTPGVAIQLGDAFTLALTPSLPLGKRTFAYGAALSISAFH